LVIPIRKAVPAHFLHDRGFEVAFDRKPNVIPSQRILLIATHNLGAVAVALGEHQPIFNSMWLLI
jgi:hypothetical protein